MPQSVWKLLSHSSPSFKLFSSTTQNTSLNRDLHSEMATRWVYSPLASCGLPRTRRGEPPLPALMYKRGGCLALASKASNNRASPHLTSPRLICLTIHNIQIYCLEWNACISYVTSNGATSPTAATSLTDAVSPLAAASPNGVTKQRHHHMAPRH